LGNTVRANQRPEPTLPSVEGFLSRGEIVIEPFEGHLSAPQQ
jgi:hypothetical protein